MKRLRLTGAAILTSLAITLLIPACAGTNSHPNLPPATALRAGTADFVDAFTIGQGWAKEAMLEVNKSTQISTAEKDRIACAIENAWGNPAPTPTEVRVCGPIPKPEEAKVTKAMSDLERVTTAAARQTALQTGMDAFTAVCEAMEATASGRLKEIAMMMRLTVKPIVLILGGGR